MSDLVNRLKDAMKDAMRAKDKARLGTIRLVLAAVKQHEVDNRVDVDDDTALLIIDKNLKQRRESIKQYEAAGRDDLAAVEYAEIEVLQDFMPQQLTAAEISELVSAAVKQTGAESVRDMGKVMGILKPQVQGRADMSAVSQQVKAHLS